jgi:hypothetical protein
VKLCETVKVEEDGIEIIATQVSPPFPLGSRVFVDARYMWNMNEKDEFVVIFSSKGNEKELKEYIELNNLSSSTPGFGFMSGYWFKPIKKEGSIEVLGTTVFHVMHSDFGGSVP